MKMTYETRIVALKQHLQKTKDSSEFMAQVYQNEISNIVRVADGLMENNNVMCDQTISPKQAGKMYMADQQMRKREKFEEKPVHGYLTRKIEDMEGVDKIKSKAWYKDKYMTCLIQKLRK